MGRLFSAEEYNPEGYLKAWALTIYNPMYKKAVSYLPDNLKRVADIGCGIGNMAKWIGRAGYETSQYLGVDFSGKMIAKARELNPGFEFIVGDIYNQDIQEAIDGCDVWMMLEFLEHVRDDVEVIRSIPSGKRVVFAVPNFDSKSHVRWFDNKKVVTGKYGDFVRFEDSETFKIIKRKRIFVFKGKRK